MKSTRYSRFSLKVFERLFSRIDEEQQIEKNIFLDKAAILMECKEYYSMTVMSVLLGLVISVIVSLMLHLFFVFPYSTLIIFLLPLIVVFSLGSILWRLPSYYIKRRARHIDLFLPYAINFISSMAVAGISPAEIFSTLAKIELYGELQIEALKIAKEINVMGIDNITALKNAIDISPSRKFQEFLQGIIGTVQAGSELHMYLQTVVEKFMEEDLVERKKDLDLLAIIAEVFVIAVIAFPVFLVIILTVFGFFGGSITLSINILVIFSVLFLPLIYAGFYYLIASTSLEEISKVYTKKKNYTIKQYYQDNKLPFLILFLSVVILAVFYFLIILLSLAGLMTFTFYTQLDFIFLAILFLIGPIGIYSYLEMKKKQQIQQRLPDLLVELGDSLSTGMTIFDAIKVASKAHYGRLTAEIKKMKAQLSWDISMKEVFLDFGARMKSAIIQRIVLTLNRGLDMGGNTSKIFKATALEVGQVNRLENQRRAIMYVYTIVIMVCFFVFLSIIVILDRTIFTSFFELQENQVLQMGSVVIRRFDPIVLKYALYSFVFVQSIGAGILGGFMMDGKLSSGIRYSCALGLISFFIFKFFL